MEEKLLDPYPTPFCRIIDPLNFPNLRNKINLEDTLNLALAVVNDVDALPQIDQFNSFFKLKNGHNLPNPMVDIAYDAFEAMYTEAFKLRTADEKFITGLRIYYALTGANFDVKLLFKPVCYNWNAAQNRYDFVEGTKKYFYTVADGFKEYTGTENIERNYRDQISILHDGAGAFGNHDSTSDANSVTYPFQTIYTLMTDNKNDGDNFVTVKNALYRKPDGTLSAKHSLLLRTIRVAVDFRDMYANRSHLCPPGCSFLTKTELDVHSQGVTICL